MPLPHFLRQPVQPQQLQPVEVDPTLVPIQQAPVPTEPQTSFFGRLAGNTLSGLAAVGNFLDVPGSMVRDTLTLRNPLDQLLTPFSDANRTTGRQMLADYGLTTENDPNRWELADFAGFGAELGADPFFWPAKWLKPFGMAADAAKGASVGGELLRAGYRATPEAFQQGVTRATEPASTFLKGLFSYRHGGQFTKEGQAVKSAMVDAEEALAPYMQADRSTTSREFQSAADLFDETVRQDALQQLRDQPIDIDPATINERADEIYNSDEYQQILASEQQLRDDAGWSEMRRQRNVSTPGSMGARAHAAERAGLDHDSIEGFDIWADELRASYPQFQNSTNEELFEDLLGRTETSPLKRMAREQAERELTDEIAGSRMRGGDQFELEAGRAINIRNPRLARIIEDTSRLTEGLDEYPEMTTGFLARIGTRSSKVLVKKTDPFGKAADQLRYVEVPNEQLFRNDVGFVQYQQAENFFNKFQSDVARFGGEVVDNPDAYTESFMKFGDLNVRQTSEEFAQRNANVIQALRDITEMRPVFPENGYRDQFANMIRETALEGELLSDDIIDNGMSVWEATARHWSEKTGQDPDDFFRQWGPDEVRTMNSADFTGGPGTLQQNGIGGQGLDIRTVEHAGHPSGAVEIWGDKDLPIGEVALNTQTPHQENMIREMFNVPDSESVTRMGGIWLDESLRNQGVGKRLYLEMADKVDGWIWNNQSSDDAIRTLDSLERDGLLEVKWNRPQDRVRDQHRIMRITEKGREALGAAKNDVLFQGADEGFDFADDLDAMEAFGGKYDGEELALDFDSVGNWRPEWDQPVRKVDAFYSLASKVADDLPDRAMDLQELKGTLKKRGVKQDELDWLDLDSAYKMSGSKKLTKEEIRDWVSSEGVELEEQVISDNYRTIEGAEGVLPTTKNVREINLTLKGYELPSQHHDNSLAYVRVGDQVTQDGKKILMMENVQSDFLQGNQGNLKKGEYWKKVDDTATKADEALALQEQYGRQSRELIERRKSLREQRDALPRGPEREALDQEIFDVTRELDTIGQLEFDARAASKRRGVDISELKAPFQKNWHELLMKRVLKYAADNGYDGIAWTPASIQKQRWGIFSSGSNEKFFDILYDEKMPSFAKKYSKKMGGRYGEVDIPNIETPVGGPSVDAPLKSKAILFDDAARKSYQQPQQLFQGERGAVEFLEDGRNIMYLFENADASTFMHESAHIFRRAMSTADQELATRMDEAITSLLPEGQRLTDNTGRWTREAEEVFASGFETYLKEGKAPNAGLKKAFESFKQWITDIYRRLTGTSGSSAGAGRMSIADYIRGEMGMVTEGAGSAGRQVPPTININDELRAVFDDMLSTTDPIIDTKMAGSKVSAIKDSRNARVEYLGGRTGTHSVEAGSKTNHWPRYVPRKIAEELQKSGFSPNEFQTAFDSMKMRRADIRNLPTATVEELLSNRRYRGPGSEQRILEDFGDQLDETFGMPRDTEVAAPEDSLFDPAFDDMPTEVTGEGLEAHAASLAEFVKQHNRGTLYQHTLKADMDRYIRGMYRVEAGLTGLHNYLSSRAALNAGDATIPLSQVYDNLNLNTDQIRNYYQKEFGMNLDELRVSREVASTAKNARSMLNPQRLDGPIAQAVDKFNRWFKSGVTLPFPAFHARNFLSGQVVNFMFNDTNPKEYLASFNEAIDIARNVDNLTDEQLRFVEEAYTHGVVDEGYVGFGLDDTIHPHNEHIPEASRLIPGINPLQSRADAAREVSAAGVPSWINQLANRSPRAAEYANRYTEPLRVLGQQVMGTGGNAGRVAEYFNRMPLYITLRKQGMDAAEAAAKVEKLHFNYAKLTLFEKDVAKRAIPFWTFSRKMSELVVDDLIKNPGGKLAQTIRATRLSQQDDPATPEYVSQTTAIPFGKLEDGTASYLTGFGMAHEDPLSFIGADRESGMLSPQSSILELLSRTSPLIKAPIELATGESFFQKGPMGGRELIDMDPTLGRLASNVSEWAGQGPIEDAAGRAYPVGGNFVEHLVANSPYARFASTARAVTDPRKYEGGPFPGSKALLNTFTGLRVSDVSPEAQQAVIRERVSAYARENMGAKMYQKVYFSKEQIANTEQENPELASQMKLINRMQQLFKKKKEEKVVED